MRTFIVDAFTDTPFRGNPAGVCLPDSTLGEETMQSIAQELNLSETAFVQRQEEEGAFAIRYFSPKMEIPLCGHATLASAKVLFELYRLESVVFTTRQGLKLPVREEGGSIVMQFPIYDTRPAEVPRPLLAALGLAQVENAAYNRETGILLLQISDVQALAELQPDFAALVRSHDGINGVLVTAASAGDSFDFHSRYFWPWSGTEEDPVTGGTHTFLTKYWATRLGKTRMRSFQSSRRTGFMEVELSDGALSIRGEAVIVLEGELRLSPSGESDPLSRL